MDNFVNTFRLIIFCALRYHFVALGVEPKRIKLAGAQATLDKTMAELKEAQAVLHGIEEKLGKLEADFEGAINKQKKLKEDSDMCIVKLDRANKLIGGLGGEKARWLETVAIQKVKYELLVGDSLMTAGAVSYQGPFTGVYRDQLETLWVKG
jgi:dynein heavy chain, axonemal